MKNNYNSFVIIGCFLLTMSTLSLRAQILYQGFEDFSAAITAGWSINNLSNPAGSGAWDQADGLLGLDAPFGTPLSYAQTSYACVDPQGTISNWLISPPFSAHNGDSVIFYASNYNSDFYPDRLECRLSAAGNSINVGTTESTVGDFTTVLVTLNPDLNTTAWPKQVWEVYHGIISGLTGTTQCRIAFRYYVLDGGIDGANSSTIGLDEVYVKAGVVGIQTLTNPSTIKFYPNPVKDIMHVDANVKILNVKIADILGQEVQNIAVDANKAQLNTSSLQAGVYFVTVETVKGTSTKKINITK